MNKKWLIAFCQDIIQRGLKIRYRVTSRVNTVDEERLEWLKRSGCVIMSLGLESGSPKILKIMQKGATVDMGRKAVALSRKYIREIEASFIFGYIGEDRGTIKDTVRFAKEIGVMPSTFIATPFPGTELYRMAMEKGRIVDEEAYLSTLDKVSIFGGNSLNLTDLSADEARQAIKEAIKEITGYYFIKYPAIPFRRLVSSLREYGLARTVCKVFNKVKI